jgi:hypothetical protein
MRTFLSFALVSILFAFVVLPVYAQSPARKLARVGEQQESPSEEVVSKYRSLLDGAVQDSENRSAVAQAVIAGIKELRKRGLSAPVRELLSIDGLSGLVRRDRSFEEVLDTYLSYRIDVGLGHEEALEKMKPR